MMVIYCQSEIGAKGNADYSPDTARSAIGSADPAAGYRWRDQCVPMLDGARDSSGSISAVDQAAAGAGGLARAPGPSLLPGLVLALGRAGEYRRRGGVGAGAAPVDRADARGGAAARLEGARGAPGLRRLAGGAGVGRRWVPAGGARLGGRAAGARPAHLAVGCDRDRPDRRDHRIPAGVGIGGIVAKPRWC